MVEFSSLAEWMNRIGFSSAVAAFLIIYMTRTIGNKLDALAAAMLVERTTREQFQQTMIKELTTQTIYLSQLLLRHGMPHGDDSSQPPPSV